MGKRGVKPGTTGKPIPIGSVFGKLTVIGAASRIDLNGKWVALSACRCQCGNGARVANGNLKSGHTKSCGCIKVKHRQSKSPTYVSWLAMLTRCFNETDEHFKSYGARGITVCERWLKFENFLADMGLRPIGHTVDRKDNDGNYEPGNCRWATPKQQSRNQRNTIYYTVDGITACLADHCDRYGVRYDVVYSRINIIGWTLEKSLSTPTLPLVPRRPKPPPA